MDLILCACCHEYLDPEAFSPGLRTGKPSRHICRACKNTQVKAYQHTHRGTVKQYNQAYDQQNREKRAAKALVRHAVADGRLTPQSCCVCGASDKIHAHHWSYEREHWLSVIWLCPKHHKAVHAGTIDWKVLPIAKGILSQRYHDKLEAKTPLVFLQ